MTKNTFTVEDIAKRWEEVVNFGDYSRIEEVPLEKLFANRDDMIPLLMLPERVKAFFNYLRERQLGEIRAKKDEDRMRKDRKRWIVAFIVMPSILFFFSAVFGCVNLYFQELRNRPYVTIGYKQMRIIGHHVELREDGTSYQDQTRKDLKISFVLKNSGNTPANIVMTEKYLTYEGAPLMPIGKEDKKINVSPVQPLDETQYFMILNEHANDFVLEITIYYYGGKFLGHWYLGRPYKYYVRARCKRGSFSIIESKDIR